MSDTKTASWIAALERARAELEGALSVDALWRSPRGAAGDTDWAGYDKALRTNPVYRCWAQLNEAIDELRKPQAEPAAVRRRISLRDVLEQIRSNSPLVPGSEPEAAASPAEGAVLAQTAAPPGPEPSAASSPATPPAGSGPVPPEAEEATVSFVIREPVRRAPAAGQRGERTPPKQPAPPTISGPEPDSGAEAEVVIVRRGR